MIIRLGRLLAEHRGISTATVSTYAANDGKVIARLERGADLTTRRGQRILQWFSDHWPPETPWPMDIPRPAPAPDSPAAAPVEDVLAAVLDYSRRMHDAADAKDHAAVDQLLLAMIEVSMTLGEHGQIKSPDALCKALGVRRYVYDDVVRRYAGQPAWKEARNSRSPVGQVLQALRDAGDVRFTGHGSHAA